MPRDVVASAAYYLANKERIKEAARLYYYHMTPECQARNRKYYSQNKDKIRAQRGRTKREPPKPKEPKPVKQRIYVPPKSRKVMEFPEVPFEVSFS